MLLFKVEVGSAIYGGDLLAWFEKGEAVAVEGIAMVRRTDNTIVPEDGWFSDWRLAAWDGAWRIESVGRGLLRQAERVRMAVPEEMK